MRAAKLRRRDRPRQRIDLEQLDVLRKERVVDQQRQEMCPALRGQAAAMPPYLGREQRPTPPAGSAALRSRMFATSVSLPIIRTDAAAPSHAS
ncbi:hypothetical protein [Bosea sp. (in: a-proteobacteria)]|uniref:hypothetical protein n=1 Tax=Bosea sp. (in: a-proteobacteria) TaxID=1871050 RepID=UPI003F704889